MPKEKKSLSSDEDSNILEEYNSKKKRRSRKKMNKMIVDFKKDPKILKRAFIKTGLYLWTFAVVLSVLSLVGFPISSFIPSGSNEDSSSVSRTLRSESFSISNFNVFQSVSEEEEEEIEEKEEEEELFEPMPKQTIITPKQGNKLNKKLEKELACEETSCVDSCSKKMKPKCSKSASCRKDREKLCKKRCRKQRCEDRCKDEPKFGYVEREQRMEKCKDECSGPTAVHNKCIKKCHSQFKPCKSRCHEIASKFICDKESLVAVFSKEEEVFSIESDSLSDLLDDAEMI